MITSISSRTLNLLLGSSLTAVLMLAGCQGEAFSSNPASRAQGQEAMAEGNYADAADPSAPRCAPIRAITTVSITSASATSNGVSPASWASTGPNPDARSPFRRRCVHKRR